MEEENIEQVTRNDVGKEKAQDSRYKAQRSGSRKGAKRKEAKKEKI